MRNRLIKRVLSHYLEAVGRKVEDSAWEPRKAQEALLKRILREQRGARVALESGFSRVRRLEDLRALPITDADSMAAHFEQARLLGSRDRRRFGRSPLSALIQTSGTSANAKHIPATRASIDSFRRTSMAMTAALRHNLPVGEFAKVIQGKNLFLTPSAELGQAPGGVRIGYASGLLALEACERVPRFTLPSRQTQLVADWDDKLQRILVEAEGQNVTAISGMPRLALAFTHAALKRFGVTRLREIWPGLRAYNWGGVPLPERARQEFRELWTGGKRDLLFRENYGASEAPCAFSWDQHWPGLVFNSREVLFQFKEYPSGGDTLQLDELEAGREYLVLITTYGGLVNYRLGDVLKVTSTAPLCCVFSGRDREEISMAGEKVNAAQAGAAFQKLAEEFGLGVVDFALHADAVHPRLNWVIGAHEIAPTRPFASPQLAARLDELLAAENASFSLLRFGEGALRASVLASVPQARFNAYYARNLARGQFKGKRLFSSAAALYAELGLEAQLHQPRGEIVDLIDDFGDRAFGDLAKPVVSI